jgi:RNA polymerase sigma factor (sigma-70 family)
VEAGLRACRRVPNETALLHWSDEELALAVKKGCFAPEMFEELMARRYERQVYCWLFRRTHDREKALDLTQEVHVRLWQTRLGHYDLERGPFRPWLSTVVHRLAIDAHRRQRGLRWLSGDGWDHPDPHPGPEEEAVARETETRVKEVLSKLRKDQRRILEEAMRGRGVADVALELRLPKADVYRLLYRARREGERILGGKCRPEVG